MSNLKLFGLSVLCTTIGMLGYLYVQHQIDLNRRPALTVVSPHVFLTSQLRPANLGYLRLRHVRTIVDLRPDGEAADQPSSQEMKSAATSHGLDFYYIPVPHEALPNDAVGALQQVLSKTVGDTVLYCRTGRRAVRLFALASASQPEGPTADEIHRIVRSAGFTSDDLTENIAERIAKRSGNEKAPR